MASPASSTTMSDHPDENYLGPDGEEGDISHSRRKEEDAIISSLPLRSWKVQGIMYDEHDDSFIIADEYHRPARDGSLSAPIRAAAHPNPRVLHKVLNLASEMYRDHVEMRLEQRVSSTYCNFLGGTGSRQFAEISQDFGPNSLRVNGSEYVGVATPLLEAICHGYLENVKVLLNAGAHSNGVPSSVIDEYAALFLRFRPQIPSHPDKFGDLASRHQFLELMDLPQTSNLTWEEVEDRLWDGMAPFWCEEGFTPKNFYRNGDLLPSLVAAANCGSTQIFDLLLEAGADATFWLALHDKPQDNTTPSSLSVSSPLHAAVDIGNLTMVQHLLGLGFNPNILPLTAPTTCYTPLMATLFSQGFSKAIFDALVSQPGIKPEIRTPVYQVHILHFAVARLDLDILRYVSSNARIPLVSAGTTAMGHTLLHIACMPPNSLHIQRRAEIVHRSIHETRDMTAFNDPHAQFPPEFDEPIERYETHFKAQTAIVKFIWENGISNIEAKDIHGNTPLHYLAGCQSMNWGVLDWLRAPRTGMVNETVDKVWAESRNVVGATPEELAEAVERVRNEDASGWRPWFERHNSRARVERKEYIWRLLLPRL